MGVFELKDGSIDVIVLGAIGPVFLVGWRAAIVECSSSSTIILLCSGSKSSTTNSSTSTAQSSCL